MTQDAFLMLVRMALQAAGVFAVSHGVFTQVDWTTFAGALLTVAPIGWSFWARRQAALKATVANMPNTVVVTAAPSTTTTTLANKIAALPESQTIISTPAIAAVTPSEKVVAQ